MTTRSLAWGIRDIVPESAVAAWGARMILRSGNIDIVWDRTDKYCAPGSEKKFARWLEKKVLPWVRKEAKSIYSNENQMHSFDDKEFHIRCNAQASYGYLYVSAWMEEPCPTGQREASAVSGKENQNGSDRTRQRRGA